MSTSIDHIPVFPSLVNIYTWTDSNSSSCRSHIHTDSHVWGSPCALPKPSTSCSTVMEQSQSEEFQAQLELFQKLGFSQAQVRAVLLKLGLHTDTNRVLGELIQAGLELEDRKDPPTRPALVSRGDGSVKNNTSSSSPAEQEETVKIDDSLRAIVIDGSNIAMSHGNKEVFSCLGIQLAVQYFLDRGHDDITVFVPSWRREQPRPDVPITDQQILRELERRKFLVFTPSRRVGGKRVVCYDDRFIVKLAYELDGIIVSNDTYRDLQAERQEWKRFIEERLLMYSFVNDKFMPPDDPLGRHGPTLDNFLRKTPRVPKKLPCPYGKKCTYGIKCKFSHPERTKQSHRSLADELREKAKMASSSSVQGASLEEVMEQKLTLDVKGPQKKVHTSENVPVLRSGPQSTQKKFLTKRERPGQHSSSSTSLDSFHTPSQEHLDSGLGSYECSEPPSSSHKSGGGGGEHRSSRPQSAGGRSQYPPAPSSGHQHQHPSPGHQHPSPGHQHPSPGHQHPSSGHQHPSPGYQHQHPSQGHQHPSPGLQHPSSGHQHPSSGHQHQHPSPGLQHPSPGHQHPSPGHQHPSSGHQHPSPGHQHPSSGHQYPSPGLQHPSSGHQHPSSGHQHPSPGHQHQHPSPGHQHPSPGHQHPKPGLQHPSLGLTSSQHPGVIPYFHTSQYNSYRGGAPSYLSVNMPYYSVPQDYHHNRMPPPAHEYWSEPYGGYRSPPSPMHGSPPDPAKSTNAEREQVRKKLRAVFNARLVDRAMDMFPSVMDPQKLAIEIINLQSYEGVL